MTEILLEKRGGFVRPADERGWKLLGRLGDGQTFVADVKDPTRRSGEQHRYWFALAHTLFENQSHFTDFDSFRACLLIKLGYCETYTFKDGTEVPVPKSLKFGKMDAEEFGGLVNATLDFAESVGWDRDELTAQVRAA